jgi:hypothetical protein
VKNRSQDLKNNAIQTQAKSIKMAVTPDSLVETKMLTAPTNTALNPIKNERFAKMKFVACGERTYIRTYGHRTTLFWL